MHIKRRYKNKFKKRPKSQAAAHYIRMLRGLGLPETKIRSRVSKRYGWRAERLVSDYIKHY